MPPFASLRTPAGVESKRLGVDHRRPQDGDRPCLRQEPTYAVPGIRYFVPGMSSPRYVLLALLVLCSAPAEAQRRFGGGGGGFGGACGFSWDNDDYFVSPFFSGNPLYDGRVTFARIKY